VVRKKACDSVKREVLYNILIEFGIPKKLVRHENVWGSGCIAARIDLGARCM
jgi:hypothetical protein